MIDLIEYYQHKGHVFGECMTSPNTDLMYINIPKNASSWTKPNLEKLGWSYYNYIKDDLYHKHSLVVLRDPVERWLSGIAEYMYVYHRDIDTDLFNKSFYDLVFDRVAFDDHTESQSLFLQNINLDNCTFFWCDHTYRQKFSSVLKYNFSNVDYVHVTDASPERTKFKKLFTQVLDENSTYQQQLEQYYKKDYTLIGSVNFYAG